MRLLLVLAFLVSMCNTLPSSLQRCVKNADCAYSNQFCGTDGLCHPGADVVQKPVVKCCCEGCSPGGCVATISSAPGLNTTGQCDTLQPPNGYCNNSTRTWEGKGAAAGSSYCEKPPPLLADSALPPCSGCNAKFSAAARSACCSKDNVTAHPCNWDPSTSLCTLARPSGCEAAMHKFCPDLEGKGNAECRNCVNHTAACMEDPDSAPLQAAFCRAKAQLKQDDVDACTSRGQPCSFTQACCAGLAPRHPGPGGQCFCEPAP